MLTTPNYALKKPEGTDIVNIDDFNGNADIIDQQLNLLNTTKASLASPNFTGIPLAPTATTGDNSTKIANTAFVTTALANKTSVSGNAGTATKLATARNIALTGDVTGSGNFDGSANISITTTVADDSHNHVIGNVGGLQASLDAINSSLSQKANKGTPTEYNLPLSSGYSAYSAKYSLDEFNRLLLALHDFKKSDSSVFSSGSYLIGQLPSGFLPNRYYFSSAMLFDNGGSLISGTLGNIIVYPDGKIYLSISNPASYSIIKCAGQILAQC